MNNYDMLRFNHRSIFKVFVVCGVGVILEVVRKGAII